jgi:putative hydrolase of the HAD superfamily
VSVTRAVFVDALGTLIEMEPPWRYLRSVVPAEVDDERLVAAVRTEMGYYKAHAHEGRDAESLAELRARCARVLSDELGVEVGVDELVEAVRMRAYEDSEPALRSLRERDLGVVVVSNWDCSLDDVLARCGLGELTDGAVSSAEAGARKPDPAIFAPALELAGCEASEALHVGDTAEEDVEGARAAGIPVLLLDREGEAGETDGVDTIASLTEIVEHLRDG